MQLIFKISKTCQISIFSLLMSALASQLGQLRAKGKSDPALDQTPQFHQNSSKREIDRETLHSAGNSKFLIKSQELS